MKTKTLISTLVAVSIAALNPLAHGQGFDSGSTGKDGALNVTADMTLDLPPDGILNFTTINVNTGTTLRFNANKFNTPVYLLAMGDVLIDGLVDVSGSAGTDISGGKGGPGGFDGGNPGLAGSPPSDGKGPGAGKAGVGPGFGEADAGAGVYATRPVHESGNDGVPYGSPLLVPLVGGSGGGGAASRAGGGPPGGGGGGGALLIASNTRITVSKEIRSQGGATGFNPGSGGAVRLVAPLVQGNGLLDVSGGGEGSGRVRIDTIDKSQIRFRIEPTVAVNLAYSVGSFMIVFPPNNPRLDIVEAAGTTIAEGVASPVTVNLPFGSDPNRTITVQARNFKAVVPIEVVLTPDNGPGISVKAQIDNAAANPAIVKVPVTFPLNTPVTVNAWIR